MVWWFRKLVARLHIRTKSLDKIHTCFILHFCFDSNHSSLCICTSFIYFFIKVKLGLFAASLKLITKITNYKDSVTKNTLEKRTSNCNDNMERFTQSNPHPRITKDSFWVPKFQCSYEMTLISLPIPSRTSTRIAREHTRKLNDLSFLRLCGSRQLHAESTRGLRSVVVVCS